MNYPLKNMQARPINLWNGLDNVILPFVLGLIFYVGLQNYVPERTVEVIKYQYTEELYFREGD